MGVVLLLFIGACLGVALTLGGLALSVWYDERHDTEKFTPEKARAREREDRLKTERMLLDDWQRRYDRAVPPPPKPKVDVLPQFEFPIRTDSPAYLGFLMAQDQAEVNRMYADLSRTRSMH